MKMKRWIIGVALWASLGLVQAQIRAHPDVDALIQRATEARQQQREQEALRLYQQAIETARALHDRAGEASAHHNMGVALILMGRPQQAIESLQSALSLWRDLKNRFGEANSLHNLGTAYANLGKARDALGYYEQALAIRQQLGHQAGIAATLQGIGSVYYAMRDLQTAQRYFEQALALYRERGDKVGEADTLRYMGNLLYVSGQWQKALAAYEQSYALYREANNLEGQATTLAGMGALFLDMGQPELALGYYLQVLELRQQAGRQPKAVIAAHLGVGHLYSMLGDDENAQKEYQQALALSREIGDKHAETAALTALANTQARRLPTQAESLYRQALLVAQATSDQMGQANALLQLGVLYAGLNRGEEAIRCFEKALTLYRALGDRRGEMVALSNLGAAYVNRGEKSKGADYYLQAIDLAERLRESLSALTEGKMAFQQNRHALYARTISLLLSLNRLEEAFTLAQKAKARTMTDLMGSGRVNLAPYLTAEEREQERVLRYQLDRASQNLLAARANPDTDPALIEQLRTVAQQAEREWQVFMDSLYARYPALKRQYALQIPSLEEIARSLSPDTALLEYLHLQPSVQSDLSYVLIFCLTNERGKPQLSARLVPLEQTPLAERTESFVLSCAVPTGDYVQAAQAMYRLLIAPVESQIANKKRLILCPDSTLWDVPFQALHNGKRFLLEQYELIYAPSATVAMLLRELRMAANRPRPEREMLVVANPQFGMLAMATANEARPLTAGSRPLTTGSRPLTTGSRPLTTGARPLTTGARPLTTGARPLTTGARPLTTGARNITGEWLAEVGIRVESLPGTEQEAQEIAQLFPQATLLTQRDAQEATLKAILGQYRYVHLATHGYFSDAAPLQSGLLLAEPTADSGEDGILTARELMELSLSAEMVVLSACETARGQARPGEGAIGMVWALTVSGVPTQVLSQWKVSDESTAMLMSHYYQSLRAGQSPAAALRAAALMLKQQSRFQHPYYWAPFICISSW
jgi:CHAT domain-containing protein/Tfp pilus assembly protein PilF